jgi:hypothetical protein
MRTGIMLESIRNTRVTIMNTKWLAAGAMIAPPEAAISYDDLFAGAGISGNAGKGGGASRDAQSARPDIPAAGKSLLPPWRR